MASVTLAESAKLAQNQLVAGVIETVITVNRLFEVMPFDAIDGNALAYNRENVLGDVQNATVGDTITAKGAATFTPVTSSLTTIIGDAEINGLIQTTRSGDGNDQTAVQIASKAKSAGRQYQNQMINGDGTSNSVTGLISLCAAGQKVAAGANGDALTFAGLDSVMDAVVDKDGTVDYLMMHARTVRSYYGLLRGLGGASVNEVVELPSGKTVPAYRGVPIFRNDWLPINGTKGTGTALTQVLAGTFDDGSRAYGFAGLTAQNAAGLQVVDVGESETKDEHIWRVKWYAGLALFSEKGLAILQDITN